MCWVTIDLFNFEETVTATVATNLGGVFDSNTFEQLLGSILNLDIAVTKTSQFNGTTYLVDVLGGEGQVRISANELAKRLINLTPDQKQQLVDAGLTIVQVSSNDQPTTPTSTVPTKTIQRTIPPWAVAVIVVLNSVIIIAVLLIVLGITWRRYKR